MKSDRLIGLTVLVLCTLTWFVLLPYQVEGEEQQIFPKAVLVMLICTSCWMVAKPHPDKARAVSNAETLQAQRGARLKTGAMALCYLAYLLLIPVTGFFVSSLVATPFFFMFLGVRKPLILTCVPVGILAAIYLVIEYGLNFTMPRGLLF